MTIVISRPFPTVGRSAGAWLLCLAVAVGCNSPTSTPVVPAASNVITAISSADDEVLLRKLCTQCHLFAKPDLLPKSEWGASVRSMAQMPNYGRTIPKRISLRAIRSCFAHHIRFGGFPAFSL